MEYIHAIMMGIVQGISEFLPISSSGHLAVMQRVFDWEEPSLTFDIILHLGTLVSIFIVFRQDIWERIKNPFSKMTGLLIIATIPAVIAGLFMRDAVENYLRSGIWLAAAFTVTGFLLVAADSFKNLHKTERDISYIDALVVGVMQALAIPPGISRSGTTITGGLMRGINREDATRFSFLLALIAIAGAGALEAILLFTRGEEEASFVIGTGPMIVGFIVSAVVGYFAIKLLLKLIRACKLRYFSYYVWTLAGLILLDWLFFNIFF